MADQGTMLTGVDYRTVSTQELVKAAHDCERLVFGDIPKGPLETLQPIWQALIERVEGTTDGNGGRGF